jgi:Bacterial Ig domain/Fibronectin type III domain/Divergent InlB B-repeat domain
VGTQSHGSGEIPDGRVAEGREKRRDGALFLDRRDPMLRVYSSPFIQKTLVGFGMWCCFFFLPNVVQSATANSVMLQWEANSESDLAGYKLYQGTTAGSYSVSTDVGNVTTYTKSNLQAGLTYYFAITAYDLSGNESYPSSEESQYIANTTLDTTPPSIALTSPTNGSTLSGTVTINATATDNSGVVGVQFRLNGNNLGAEDTTDPFSRSWDTITVPNDSYTLTAIARDAAGNTTTSSPITVTVSNTSTLPSSSLTLSNLTVASGQPYVVPASGLQVGDLVYIDRSFTYTSVPASVQGAAYIQTANNDKAATTAAFLSFDVNQPVTVYVAHDVRITSKPSWLGTFTDTGTDLVTSDTTLRLFAQAFPAGTITLGGNAGGGNSMYAVIVQAQEGDTSSPDTTPPTVTLTAPGDGASVSGTSTVSATATDETGVVGVQFRLNGNNLGAEDTTDPFSRSWDTSGVASGPYTLTAIARDAAGNTTTSAPITVTVLDITPPSISLTSPITGSTLSGTVNINATATDNSGVVGVQFQLNGNNLGAEDTTSPFSISWDSNGVVSGPYTIAAIARDAAGNTTSSAPVNISISSPPSTLTVSITGRGRVTSSPDGIRCTSGTCSASYGTGSTITLTAKANKKWTFSGWSGACRGTGECVVQLSANQFVGATYSKN